MVELIATGVFLREGPQQKTHRRARARFDFFSSGGAWPDEDLERRARRRRKEPARPNCDLMLVEVGLNFDRDVFKPLPLDALG
jgi:hypothetical protein